MLHVFPTYLGSSWTGKKNGPFLLVLLLAIFRFGFADATTVAEVEPGLFLLISDPGQNCLDACAKKNLICTHESLAAADASYGSGSALGEAVAAAGGVCKSVREDRMGTPTPVIDGRGWCFGKMEGSPYNCNLASKMKGPGRRLCSCFAATMADDDGPTFSPVGVAPMQQQPSEPPVSPEPTLMSVIVTQLPTTSSPVIAPALPITPYPSSTTPPPSTQLPSNSVIMPSTDIETTWIQLIQSRMPTIVFDNDATSPKRLALDWMVQDPYTLDLLDDNDRIVQRFALAVFYYSTHGPTSWKWRNRARWLRSSSECDWGEQETPGAAVSDGVGCTRNDVVDRLELWHGGLSGTIPGEIGLLSSLKTLRLGKNKLKDSILTEIGLLPSLSLLWLDQNNFEGSIPTEMGMLSWSTQLYLYGNANLSGRVPTELADLSNLEDLWLFNTQLTGSIPSNLCSSTLEDAQINCGRIKCNCCTRRPRYTPDGAAIHDPC